MKKLIYVFIVTALAVIASMAAVRTRDGEDIVKTWIRIDSLEGQGLFRSALTLAEKVYGQARAEADQENELRALIYRLKYTQELEEDGQEKAIGLLERELHDGRLVPAALKASMLAELYQRYFTANRWEVFQREENGRTGEEEIRRMGPEGFYNVILRYYRKSLLHPDLLAKIATSSLKGIWVGSLEDTVNSPFLYDILMRRAVDFLNTADDYPVRVLRPAIMCSEDLFLNSDRFRKAIPEQELNSTDPWYQALRWYGDWLEFSHTSLTADLTRLRYVYDESCHARRDSLYLAALERTATEYAAKPAGAFVYEALAGYHLEISGRYTINGADTLKIREERRKTKEWLEKAINWKDTRAAKNCMNMLNSLLAPELSVQAEAVEIPARWFPVSVEYRNMSKVYYRIYRMKAMDYYSEWSEMETDQRISRLSAMKPIRKGNQVLPDDGDMNPHRLNMLIEPLEPGFYLMLFSSGAEWKSGDGTSVITPLSVSRITLVSRQKESGSRDFYFRDRYTGAPLEGIQVTPFYNQYDPGERKSIFEKGKSYLSGEEGILSLPDGSTDANGPSQRAYRLLVIRMKDTLLTTESFYPGYFGQTGHRNTSMSLYSDRKLYKPGDRAWFRGVLIDHVGDSLAIHHRDSITLSLQDPRYQVLQQFKLPVNEYGVFSGSVNLPIKGLTGNYLIQSPFGSGSFRMEQYARPSFTIKPDPGHRAYMNGDTIILTGFVKALSGEAVAGAEVTVETNLQPYFRRGRWMPGGERKIRIRTDKVKTDMAGRIDWKYATIAENSNPYGVGTLLQYEITFRVTDISGETHEETTLITCGKGSTLIMASFPERLQAGETLNTQIRAMGADGRELYVPARFRFSRLVSPGRTWIEPVLPEPDRFCVSKKEWNRRIPLLPYRNENEPSSMLVDAHMMDSSLMTDSASILTLSSGSEWKEGWYRAEIIPEDRTVADTLLRYVFIENSGPDKVPGGKEMVAAPSAEKLHTGDAFAIKTGSAHKGFILTEFQLSDGFLMDWWSESGKTLSQARWAVTSEWQGGAVFSVLMFRWNRVYQEKFSIDVPREKTRLTISGLEDIGTVKPGDSVRLKLSISDEKGEPVKASLGVTVYDASLDQITPHAWPQLSWPRFFGNPGFTPLQSGPTGSGTLVNFTPTWIEVSPIEPLVLNWWGFGYYGINRMEAPMMMKAAAGPGRGAETQNSASLRESAADAVVETHNNASLLAAPEQEVVPIQIRTDFRETAFFTGNLISDSDGKAEVAFIVPEVFTKWKIMAAGHDLGLAMGESVRFFQSAKDLMLKPNFPAFVRQGDSLSLASRIGWYGKTVLNPLSTLTISDLSGKILKTWDPVGSRLTAGSSALLTWNLRIDQDQKISYVLSAKDRSEQDGISDTIDVYPDHAELWRSQPFFFNKPGTRAISISGEVRKALIEVTTTPAWQILLSLPVVTTKERDCSEYWFSRLYLAGITGLIADKTPEVMAYFTKHTVEEILDSLDHPLMRNQEIKGRSWEETPWNRTIENERSRIVQIRKWMDKNQRSDEVIYLLEKLSGLQNPDGTWPWFRGMGTDWFATQQIIAGFGELNGWQVMDITSTQRGRNMVTKALEAMDGWMSSQYREMMRADSTGSQKVQLNPMIIHYLYTRSFYSGWTISPKDELAWLHYMDRIPIEWTQHDPGLQALMAITGIQMGRVAVAGPIYRSLRERMTESEEMGAWWPKKGYASSWYQWDLWMQSKMIELFAAMPDGRKDLDKLRLYLIHQKRGRDWGNGMVAAWASKSLLFFGSDLLTKPAQIGIKWGTEVFTPLRIQTGSVLPAGYYRFKWDNPATIPDAKSLNISHSGGGPAWGTLFTLENQKLDKLAATEGPLHLFRDLLIRNSKGDWIPLPKSGSIQPGELVKIRIRIHSDRELSYIEIKDYLGTGFIPVRVLSGYQYNLGLSWYQAREPESVLFYLSTLPKGEHTIEYTATAEQAGNYFGGYSVIQSLYAPEFRAWSGSARIDAKR